ncbi:MAG TPA: glycosyltransferase [Conexibacter sp.]|nr:glycosyltransferase [Conexibacter sp.]
MIGWYVHHHGAGHLARATTIAERLATPLTVLSSLPRPERWRGGWIELPRDDAGSGREAAAGGALHWAPLHDDGLRTRMAVIAAWIGAARPRLFVADVSCEVAAFVRLLGVPLVVVGMPGTRTDAPHQLAYRLAGAILAPWPAWAEPLTGVEPWRGKLHAVGAISRFEGRQAPVGADGARGGPPQRPDAPERSADALPQRAGGPKRRVLLISGRGGSAITAAQVTAARRATPQWTWDVLGPPAGRWEPDPWPALKRADVVVCHAGQNLLADVAAARRPAIVLPQARPFDEQHATADVLDRAGLATVLRRWPRADEWPALLQRAAARDGALWARWAPGDGAARAAALLDRLTGDPAPEELAASTAVAPPPRASGGGALAGIPCAPR